jgi:hypothetical protein
MAGFVLGKVVYCRNPDTNVIDKFVVTLVGDELKFIKQVV